MVKTLRIFCLAAALIAAGILFYTKAVAPGETRDSDVSISLPEEPLEYTSNQEVLGTAVSQSVYGDKAAETIETVNNILYDFSAHWDNTLVDSVPGQVAASAGLEPSVLAEEDYQVIRRAFDLAQQTEGLFDPTVGALTSVWADGEPSADQVSWALTYTGWQEVSLSDEDMSAGIGRPGITLDMGAVVPGMAVQAALEAYQEAGIDGGVITMDGTAAMTGTKSEGGESFTIGLRTPMDSNGDHYAVLQADDVVICTADGESRLLNPADGYPVETDLLAVTVLSEDGFLSDAMSSILYMQGLDKALEHLDASDYQVILVAESGEIYFRRRFGNLLPCVILKIFDLPTDPVSGLTCSRRSLLLRNPLGRKRNNLSERAGWRVAMDLMPGFDLRA